MRRPCTYLSPFPVSLIADSDDNSTTISVIGFELEHILVRLFAHLSPLASFPVWCLLFILSLFIPNPLLCFDYSCSSAVLFYYSLL